ncbi:DUF2191 domain-containing protein [Actinoplanes sp. M2I2]|uniref:DUF2191 domain-containing protein n=1 Tax=Actinoplanes sp. M2I2 TaxID=1734444 RepID=UPI00201FED5E|nr:DUF2191 domain-containing protein [Actinoplanes sp. M2I2]
MSEFRVEVDDRALTAAARMFGTATREETVTAAVEHAAQCQRRGEAFDRLAEMADAGDFDILLDKRNYRV